MSDKPPFLARPQSRILLGAAAFLAPVMAALLIAGAMKVNAPDNSFTPSPNAIAAADFFAKAPSAASVGLNGAGWGSVVGAYGMNCPDSLDPSGNGDSCMNLEFSLLDYFDDKTYCQAAIALAQSMGGERDVIVGERKGELIGEKSVSRCLETIESEPRSVGWGWFSLEYYLKGTSSEGVPWVMMVTRNIQSSVGDTEGILSDGLQRETYGYSFILGTDFSGAYDQINVKPNYDLDVKQMAAMLDSLSYFRYRTTTLGVYDEKLFQLAKDFYVNNFKPKARITPYVDAGEVTWVDFRFDSGAKYCLAVATGKESAGNPGSIELGGLGVAIQSMKERHNLGDYIKHACG